MKTFVFHSTRLRMNIMSLYWKSYGEFNPWQRSDFGFVESVFWTRLRSKAMFLSCFCRVESSRKLIGKSLFEGYRSNYWSHYCIDRKSVLPKNESRSADSEWFRNWLLLVEISLDARLMITFLCHVFICLHWVDLLFLIEQKIDAQRRFSIYESARSLLIALWLWLTSVGIRFAKLFQPWSTIRRNWLCAQIDQVIEISQIS
jgi:hypothetical protein